MSVHVQGCGGVYRGCVWVVPDFHGGLHRIVSGAGFSAVRGQGGVVCYKLLVILEIFFLGLVVGDLFKKRGGGYMSMTMSVFLILSVRSPLLARSLSTLSVSISQALFQGMEGV